MWLVAYKLLKSCGVQNRYLAKDHTADLDTTAKVITKNVITSALSVFKPLVTEQEANLVLCKMLESTGIVCELAR
jgi:hypothetical protein